ncbi:transposase (plasmid) [Haloplanus ruber]|uniref:Transposase n=1 Tax=Haloplanus ruber TaxID=869892 RepID=A0ABD6D5H6_9EURY|nr:transposase [Haloplanus ruber]
MPFARLLNYIEYKAHDAGIDVQLVDEYDTSKTCKRCASEGVRATQGRFECPECGLDDNADKNGALNIGKRALGKFSKPLSEAGDSPKRRSSSHVTTNLRTSPFPWVQPQ